MGLFNLQPEINLSGLRKNVFSIISLSIIILTIYSNTFHASWHFDDEGTIINNKRLHLSEINWPNIKNTFFASKDGRGRFYRPVSCLSFAINFFFGKIDVFGYHIVNITIHLLASVFLFLFISQALALPGLKAKYRPNSYFIALLSTTLWAINPIQTQAITYIVQRMASMAGMFYVIAMYFYLKGRVEKKFRSKIVFFGSSIVTGLLSIGCKENALMLPVSIYLFDLFLIQGLTKETFRKNVKPASALALLVLFMWILYYYLSHKDIAILSLYQERAFTLKERLLSQPGIILFYLSLIFYPVTTRLSIDHDVAISKTLINPPATLIYIGFIIAILVVSLYLSRRRPFISYGIIFFFLNHLIESSIFPLELVFEHRNYIPSMFLFVPVVVLLLNAIKYYSSKKPLQIIIIVFIISVIVGQGHSTFIRNYLWKTEESLWMAATEKAPDLWRPWHNLGKYYGDKNMHKDALTNYFTALSKKITIDRRDKNLTFYNIGVEYHKMGEKDKAFLNYLKAERINPFLPKLHNNKGVILAEKGRTEEAIYEFSEAIRYNKNLHEAYSNLGFLLLKLGRIEEAIKQLEMAFELKPDNTSTLLRLGYAYRKKGLYGKAFLLFKRAQKLDPQNPKVFLYIAEIYSHKGMNLQADKTLEQFIESTKDADLHSLLEEIKEKEETFERIQVDKEVLMKLLCKAYLEKTSLISSIRAYLDEKEVYICDGEVNSETQ
jgi:tetratricopeptide (TPR) repeat protein